MMDSLVIYCNLSFMGEAERGNTVIHSADSEKD